MRVGVLASSEPTLFNSWTGYTPEGADEDEGKADRRGKVGGVPDRCVVVIGDRLSVVCR